MTLVLIYSVLITPSYSSDYSGNCFSSLTWEEHVFIGEDEPFIITIISFFVSDNSNQNSDNLYLDLVVLSGQVDKVLLYPRFEEYKDIKNISLSESSHPTEIIPQKVNIIRVNFQDTIRDYGRYSFAILTTIDGFIHSESPFLNIGRTTQTIDGLIWVNSYESNIDSVPVGSFSFISQNIEGFRSTSEFPRFTISYKKSLAIESKNPNPDTEFDNKPYSFGIIQEKRDGDPISIRTGLLQGTLVSQNYTLSQGDQLSFSLETAYFNPDEKVKNVIGTSLDGSKKYHTLGWFNPPSNVYIKIYSEGISPDAVFSLFIALLLPILGLTYKWFKHRKKRNQKKHTSKKKRFTEKDCCLA